MNKKEETGNCYYKVIVNYEGNNQGNYKSKKFKSNCFLFRKEGNRAIDCYMEKRDKKSKNNTAAKAKKIKQSNCGPDVTTYSR